MRTRLVITMLALALAACTSATAPTAAHDCTDGGGTTTGSGQC
jgi:hypothetical protein